ncbi:MAG: mechanosensitive ion channel family protein [Gammaproteobacteria bacterium]|nr:mechanosensitive ion channel family protein [Gammaproteobacteria bacterium]
MMISPIERSSLLLVLQPDLVSSRVLFLVILLFVLMIPGRSLGADKSPLEPLDTSSPRATLFGFLDAVDNVLRFDNISDWQPPDYQRFLEQKLMIDDAMRALDLSEVAPASRKPVGAATGVYLYEVLSRIDLPPESSVPGVSESESEIPVSYKIPQTEITLTRIKEGQRAGEYLFNPETVSRASEFYDRTKELSYKRSVPIEDVVEYMANRPGWLVPARLIDSLPAWTQARHWEHGSWKWAVLAVLVVLALGLLALVHRIARARESVRPVNRYLRSLALPLTLIMLLPVLVSLANIHLLNISGGAAESIVVFAGAITFLAIAWVVWLIPMVIAELVISSPTISSRGVNAHLLRLLARIVGISLALVSIVYGANFIGIPLVGVLAGVSIGGLAIALATQDTLKNLLGSLMIYMDKPYEIDQRIMVMGHDGVVEEIGLRSTKIRLLNGHVTSIPNEKMASTDIVNVSRRPYIQRVFNVRIAVDTSPPKISRTLEILREIFAVPGGDGSQDGEFSGNGPGPGKKTDEQPPHPNEAINNPDFPPKVYFNDLTQEYLNFIVLYWYHPPMYWDYLEHATAVNTQIMERLGAEGIEFAKVPRKLYIEDSTQLPPGSETAAFPGTFATSV